ncbi:OmpA family protein [Marinifilum sp. D737]|uniref:OmpA family protein n=1 Tax=Marinifilum sp. D737 TaxID=2969628 RepID=UPI00227641D1|nr:OmpA family protein [Marinifilum sp. D737]MCY1636634.1 OmpA family protein [Marinifilum sp. D737]
MKKLKNNMSYKIVIVVAVILGATQFVLAGSGNINVPAMKEAKASLGFMNRIRFDKAEKDYQNESFVSAIHRYEKIISKGDSLAYLMKRLAESYMEINEYENAKFWYQKLYKTNSMSDIDLYNFIEVLKINEDYEKALEINKNHPELHNLDPKLSDFTIHSIQEMKVDSSKYDIQLSPISSGASDIHPSYLDGHIVFASSRKGKWLGRKDKRANTSYLDLYSANINSDGSLGDVAPLKGKINTKFNEGSASYSKSENAIYYTINYSSYKEIGDHKINNLRIVRSQKTDKGWGRAEKLDFNDSNYSYAQPSISDNGDKLYFSSDMPGGYGGTDIYVSKRVNGKWSEPVNLGEDINTSGDEMFPYIYKDSTLYFSSNSKSGLGGLDIYVSKIKNGKFTEAQNMGYPINSSHDDFGLLLINDKYEGYITSNRLNKDDIYHFTMDPEEPKVVNDYYVMDTDKSSLIIDPLSNDLKGDAEEITVSKFTSSKGGSFEKDSVTGLYKYIPPTNFIGFDTVLYTVAYKLPDQSDAIKGTMVIKVEGKEKETKLPDLNTTIYFGFDKADIKEDAASIINSKIIPFLSKYPELQYELSAYTDALGTESYNMKLSEKRANAVMAYLKKKLKNLDNISVYLHGEKLANQAVKGVAVSDLQSDRKVEVKVLQKNNSKHGKFFSGRLSSEREDINLSKSGLKTLPKTTNVYYDMELEKRSIIIDPFSNDLNAVKKELYVSDFSERTSQGGKIEKDSQSGLFRYTCPANFIGFDTISYTLASHFSAGVNETKMNIIVDVRSSKENEFESKDFEATLYFDFDKAEIREDAEFIMSNKIIPFLREHAEEHYELSAFSDALGTADYNMKLSEKRANAVMSYLKKKLKNVNNISVRSYGETQARQVDDNTSSDKLQSDRKVQIKVLRRNNYK